MIFKTQVNDIPCYCRVDFYLPGRPDKMGNSFEDAEEGYDEEFTFTMLDHRYIQAPWIIKQMTAADCDRMLEEYHCTVLEHKHFINERD